MNWMEQRLAWIGVKWMILAVVIYYLWLVGFFAFLFVGLPWLITYVGGLIIEFGFSRVLRYYKLWWTVAFILLMILGVLVFEFIYRVKRKDFMVGGQIEGRVVWIRGIRQGWTYAVWDLYNYISWRRGKKKGEVLPMQASPKDTWIYHGTNRPNRPIKRIRNDRPAPRWPDPFAIPIGPRVTAQYVFYIRRYWLQIFPDKWFIPVGTLVGTVYNAVSIPDGKFTRVPHPTIPGKWIIHTAQSMPDNALTDSAVMTQRNRQLLGRSGKLVDKALLSDGETKKEDFTHGSFNIPQLQEDDGAYDK